MSTAIYIAAGYLLLGFTISFVLAFINPSVLGRALNPIHITFIMFFWGVLPLVIVILVIAYRLSTRWVIFNESQE